MFEWKNTYSVGIASIDGQHKNLFGIVGELHTALLAGHGKQALTPILDRLVRYTKVHFGYEERLMEAGAYPDFEAHKAEHDALTKQVLKFQEDLKDKRATITIQLVKFLERWLVDHIQTSDQKYAPCLKESAVA